VKCSQYTMMPGVAMMSPRMVASVVAKSSTSLVQRWSGLSITPTRPPPTPGPGHNSDMQQARSFSGTGEVRESTLNRAGECTWHLVHGALGLRIRMTVTAEAAAENFLDDDW
jgi:hypothetical protein